MQVRFYFLHNYKLATGSRHSNFFSFKLQQIISFSCLTNDIRHVHSIKNSISPIDDRVLIEHCSFDVVLSFTVKKFENRRCKTAWRKLLFKPRQLVLLVSSFSFYYQQPQQTRANQPTRIHSVTVRS